MAKPLLDSRYQLFHKEMIKNENELRMKWFLRNQQRLIDNLGEPKLIKRAEDVIEESEKRMKACVDKPIILRKPLPRWRPLKSDGSIDINIMKPVDPRVKALLYKKGVPTFIATNNYLTERYKKPPEKRFYFPDCPNWTYGWRIDDYVTPTSPEMGRTSIMLAQFYHHRAFNLHRDPEWFRGCQIKDAKNFSKLMS